MTTASTTSLLTKDIAKNITEGFAKSAKAFCTACATAHVGVDTGVTVLIVSRTFLRIRQHLVGLFDLLEFGFCVFGFVALMTASQKLGEKVYAEMQAQQAAAGAGAEQAKPQDDNVVDAEVKEVKKG